MIGIPFHIHNLPWKQRSMRCGKTLVDINILPHTPNFTTMERCDNNHNRDVKKQMLCTYQFIISKFAPNSKVHTSYPNRYVHNNTESTSIKISTC